MSLFKRLSATMFSQVDRVVSDIENHDAVIEAAIRDNQRALAKAKVRFNRLCADGRRLQQRLEQLNTSEAQWARRAKQNAESDEQTALQCLQKRRDCQKQAQQVSDALAEHKKAEQRLSSELATMENRVKHITQQKNLLRTRQSTADAMRTFKAIEDCSYIDIDDTFEKWEIKVMEAELVAGECSPSDTLEQQFTDSENLEELRAELDELKRGERHEQ